MLSRIENQIPIQPATPARAQTVPQSTQAFSDLLSGASIGAHSAPSPMSSTQPQTAGASSQIPVAAQANSQILDAPQPATTSTFNPLAIFEPKPVSSDSSTGPQPSVRSEAADATQPADTTSAPFVPQFQQNLEVVSSYGGSSPLNPIYFATPDTAQWIADQYGTGEVVARPYNATGGPYTANGTEYYIRLKNGELVNAGLLADYYRRMPEAQFPGLADRIIRQGLGEA